MRVSKPFLKKAEGRMYVKVTHDDGSKHMDYYARFLIEQEYGPISPGLVVHHIDGNQLNDTLENLAVLTVAQHNNIHHALPAMSFVCPICGVQFSLVGKLLKYAKSRTKNGHSGPHCSTKCSLLHRSAAKCRLTKEVMDD